MRLAMGFALFVTSFLLNAGGVALSAENKPPPEDSGPPVGVMEAQSGSEDPIPPDTAPPVTVPSISAIEPYRVEYSASYNGLPISTIRTFNKEGTTYRVATEASNFLGTIKEHETFRQEQTNTIKL